MGQDRRAFRSAALSGLQKPWSDAAARRDLLELMLKADLLPACDPSAISLEAELALMPALLELDPQIDVKLARRLCSNPNGGIPEPVALRALALLETFPQNARLLPALIRILRDQNQRVRSKAALVIGRLTRPNVVEEMLSEPDPRVRANVIEALWGMDSPRAREALRQACDDVNNRVVGNALLGLYRLGDTYAIPRIEQMAGDSRPEFRTTAAWLMERIGSPRFLPVLARMIKETDPRARSWAFHALAKIKRTREAAENLPQLRVHLLEASRTPEGKQTVRAAIAQEDGAEIPNLPATAVVLWRGSKTVNDYSVRPMGRASSMALALVLPSGWAGDAALASVSALKRGQESWQDFRYEEARAPLAMEQAFAFLGALSTERRLIFVETASDAAVRDESRWASVLARGRALSIAIETVPEGPDSCEKAYLRLRLSYEIATPEDLQDAGELKLEVFTEHGYGVSVLAL
jgi:HEAT repeat protein